VAAFLAMPLFDLEAEDELGAGAKQALTEQKTLDAPYLCRILSEVKARPPK